MPNTIAPTPECVLKSIGDAIAFLEKEVAQRQRNIHDHPGLKDDLALLTRILPWELKSAALCWRSCKGRASNPLSNWRLTWDWCRWSANHAPSCSAVPACPRPAPLG
jgi:hypothetical protein